MSDNVSHVNKDGKAIIVPLGRINYTCRKRIRNIKS